MRSWALSRAACSERGSALTSTKLRMLCCIWVAMSSFVEVSFNRASCSGGSLMSCEAGGGVCGMISPFTAGEAPFGCDIASWLAVHWGVQEVIQSLTLQAKRCLTWEAEEATF